MVLSKDMEIIRTLAGRVREIAELPEMEVRRKRWYRFNSLNPDRPMVLCTPEGAWGELVTEREIQCQDDTLKAWEMDLRRKIYWWEHIKDDSVIEAWFDINWLVTSGDYGVKILANHGENRGSFKYDHPIKDLERDIEKLHYRELYVDREATYKKLELAKEILGDILPVRIRGNFWWTMGLTSEAIKLIGLENLMLYMYDEPENLHRLMAWLRDEHLNYLNWLENNGLLTLNNGCNSVGSGGIGYSDELPKKDWKEGQPARLADLWGFAESQETVGISPMMFAEFIIPYQIPIIEKFSLNCYGCCEPIHDRWDYISKIKGLRRVSISPWCNQQDMAEKLGKNYIFSRKPHPSLVCTGFDENEIRNDIKNTLQIAGDKVLEIIMKDTHTVQNEPWRLSKWVEIALEEVNSI